MFHEQSDIEDGAIESIVQLQMHSREWHAYACSPQPISRFSTTSLGSSSSYLDVSSIPNRNQEEQPLKLDSEVCKLNLNRIRPTVGLALSVILCKPAYPLCV